MKLKIIMTLAIAAGFLAPVAAVAQKKPHIIVVTHGQVSDSFWLVVKNGVDQGAKDSGSDVEYRAPEKFDMVAMAQLITAAANQAPDGIVVSIPDADALGQAIKGAVATGIPKRNASTPYVRIPNYRGISERDSGAGGCNAYGGSDGRYFDRDRRIGGKGS